MTDIPGTSKTSFEIEKEKEKINSQPVSLSLVNVHEIKRVKKEGPETTENNWYDHLKYWLLIGLFPSLIFLVVGIFFNWSLFLMIPAGPVVAFISWYIRKIAKRYEEKTDVFK